ncbi:MAG: adenosylcobinamide-GDP ribazoletransferase [Burkholderiaceae bacterium]
MTEDARARPRPGIALRFWLALQFLTRLPTPRALPFSDAWLNESARHFPAVGALVGAVGATVLAAALSVFPPELAVLLAIAATIVVTGAFHEDGLADACDALGAGGDRARALAIMKDSRIGSFGTLALLLRLALEAATLTALLRHGVAAALALWIAAHGLSRLVPVLLIASLDYAGDGTAARARPLARRVDRATAAIALLQSAAIGAAAAAIAGAPPLAAAMFALAVLTWATRTVLARWLGGYTGDTLGAAQQLALLALPLAALAALR